MRAVTHRSLFLSLLLIMLLALMTLVTGASENGMRNASENSQRKIVVFRPGTEEFQDKLLEKHGLLKVHNLKLINAKAAFVPGGRLDELKAEFAVLEVIDDVRVFAIDKPDSPPGKNKDKTQSNQEITWGVKSVKADQVWTIEEGKVTAKGADDVKVAVIDTGIDYTHPDLEANVKGGINIINPRKSYMDDNGHGTHVAGTIAAEYNDIGVVGVAPLADLYGVKVLDRNGGGWTSDIMAGIEWSEDNGMNVINMSLGFELNLNLDSHKQLSDLFESYIDSAVDANVVVVAAAGNTGDEGNAVTYPGAYENVICVSAVGADDYDSPSLYSLAYFSTRGTQVDVTAPGVYVRSTVPGGGYRYYQGTSMASPHVAGVAALVIESEGESYTHEDIRSAIENIADDSVLVDYDTKYYGAGLVNAEDAVLYEQQP